MASYEHVVDEKELMALRELAETDVEETDSSDRAMAADLMALLHRVSHLDDAGALSPDDLAWTEGTEGGIARAAAELAAMAANILRGAAVLETWPGEEAAMATELRRQAGQLSARAAEAGRVADAARRLQEKEMRRLATLDHVVDPGVLGFLARVAGEMDRDGGVLPAAEEEVIAAAGAADRVEEEMVRLRLRFRLAAMESPGKEATVAALLGQTDKANAALAAVEAFRESMNRYQAGSGHAIRT